MIYSLSTELKAQISKETLALILSQGATLGYQYYEFGDEKKFKSILHAAEALLEPNVYDAIGIIAKKNNHDLVISIDYTDKTLGFRIGGFDFDKFDVASSTKDFLKFIEGFAILEISTFYD